MNAGTIKAALALISQRWPFPEGSEEHQASYVARLKLAVSSWTGKREQGFIRAVDALVAATNQRGRPSPEQITELALARSGESAASVKPNTLAPEDLAKDREARRRAWEADCERRRADPAEAQKAVDSIARGASLWRPNSPQRRHIAEWLRDFWGVEFQPGEFEAFLDAPTTQRPRDRTDRAHQAKSSAKEPVAVAEIIGGIVHAKGIQGFADANLGPDDKRDRAAEHRARARQAAEDFMRSREPGEDREEEVSP